MNKLSIEYYFGKLAKRIQRFYYLLDTEIFDLKLFNLTLGHNMSAKLE